MRRLTVLLALLTTPLFAQLQEKITVERILVDARVTNDSGDPIAGLKPEDFRVKIDGKLARVESADWISETARGREQQPAPAGRLLVFLFQTDFAHASTRIRGEMQLVAMRDKWIRWLEPDDRVAVLSFDSHLKLRLDFSGDKEKMRGAMEQALY